MKKSIFIVIAILIFLLAGFFVYSVYISQSNARGALQITSEPESTVYLNDKEIGRTPLCICGEDSVSEEFTNADLGGLFETSAGENLLPTGEYTLRMVPIESEYTEFQEKIIIGKSVLTVVDRTFGKGAGSEGSVIMLEKIQNSEIELSVISLPDNASVQLDSQPVGQTPLVFNDVTESDHKLTLTKSGYREKGVRIKAVKGYRLVAQIYLGVDQASLTGRGSLQDTTASESADDKNDSKEQNTLAVETVRILETGTGFLRVRNKPSLAGAEVGRVSPNESYPFLGEDGSWYQIEFEDGETGWISSEFAVKSDE